MCEQRKKNTACLDHLIHDLVFEVSIAYDLAEELEFIEDRVHRAVEQAGCLDAPLDLHPVLSIYLRICLGEMNIMQHEYLISGSPKLTVRT